PYGPRAALSSGDAGALELQHYRLELGVGLDALAAELAADARLLVAAEGQRAVEHRVAVAPDGAGLDLGRELVERADVARPHAGAEAVERVVRLPGDIVEVVEPLRYDDRAEDLLLHHAHRRVDVHQHGRVDVV